MRVLIFLILSSFIIISCTNNESTGIGINSRISACGGFGDINTIVKSNNPEDETCNEVLNWKYNSESNIISLQNDNVGLNCCGEHSINVKKIDGKYVVTEIDNSENGARCGCMCSFSYAIDIPDIKSNSIDIILKRDVEESDIETVLETTIDLSENNGSVLIKEQSGYICHD